jgi:hypothetical protein
LNLNLCTCLSWNVYFVYQQSLFFWLLKIVWLKNTRSLLKKKNCLRKIQNIYIFMHIISILLYFCMYVLYPSFYFLLFCICIFMHSKSYNVVNLFVYRGSMDFWNTIWKWWANVIAKQLKYLKIGICDLGATSFKLQYLPKDVAYINF